MVYKIDNKRKKSHGKYVILGIVLGFILSLGGFYVYENYKQPILDNVNDIIKENTPKPEIDTSPINSAISTQITDPEEIAKHIHELVNQQRSNQGLNQLVWSEKIASIAKAHSGETIGGDVTHTGLEQRLQQMGCQNGSENAAWQQGFNFNQFSERMVNGWMNSEIHRNNILNPSFTSEGIGVTISGYYITVSQNFC